VPRYSIPKVGATFAANMLDFAATPAVEVNLGYDDPQRNVHERMTLVFTSKEPQKWFIPVSDGAARAYDMSVTWHYADGSERSSTPVKLEKPAVPAEPQAIAFPCESVIVTMVLLKVAWTCACPMAETRLTFLVDERRAPLAAGGIFPRYFLYFFFAPRRRPRPATVFLMPLRVRALVRDRCPRTGRLRRWRKPR